MDTIKIFITYRCNLNCKYCFVTHGNEVMAPATLDKILSWGIKNNVKKIILTGGEPTSSFDLITRAALFMKKNCSDPEFAFDDIPSNGTQLTKEKIWIAKLLGITFSFSLDGFEYLSNTFRYRNKRLYEKVIDNIKYYAEAYGRPPKVKMTVNQNNAHLMHKNAISLVKNGLTRVQILPAFGQPWTDENTNKFLESFDKLLILHKKIKHKFKNLQIDPIDWYCEVIKSKDYDSITKKQCDMGSKVAFSVLGEASACLSTIHLAFDNPLRKAYCLGHINSDIGLKNLDKFKKYRICSEFNVDCKYHFPNVSCRKVCATVNFKTGERMKEKHIENLMKIEYMMFQKTYEAYGKLY